MKKLQMLAAAATAAVVIVQPANALLHKLKEEDVVRSVEVAEFSKIRISGVFELDVRVGETLSVELEGATSALDRVEAFVKNGELRLEHNQDRRLWKHRHDNNGVEARISVPSLVKLDVSGVVDGDIRGIQSDEFRIELSGVGDLDFTGSCGRLDARVSGVGDLDAGSLECVDVDIVVSGVGDARVFASTSVDADASGMGDITVLGGPTKVRETSGMFSDVTVR